MSTFKQQAVNFLLRDLVTGHHFDMCKVRAIATQVGMNPHDEKFQLLSEFHCVHWNKMDLKFVNELKNETLRLLGFTIENTMTPPL